MKDLIFPQAGIITSLNVEQALAKVFIPLFKIETTWIPVSTNLLYETKIKATTLERDSHTVYYDSEKISINSTASGPKETSSQETMERIEWGTLKVGNEVVVVFLNGNLNAGRVIARI
ncbi:hypothetical protein [Pelotomaculum propionicicum]|uniref:Uncharacterized protein n=1 Tax=Pelotomaculum propionicicum TaxID=258475 RepID=A0A4Y7RLX0_9FIRM|nr:hypothetical protein [Pelotomaculum propionicicum]TEB09297.1 hypothetical protein Pmgp_03229 [Pelotomaculum propionicicum]